MPAGIVFRMTGAAISSLDAVLGIELAAEGLEHLEERPALFVANHFTRMETFIVPYLLYKHTGMEVHSMASEKVLHGILGSYLRKMGTVSTREPRRDQIIIGDLMTGRCNWLIYPEGSMVKDKHVVSKGRLWIDTPLYSGAPHTGAAMLALGTEMCRRDYLKAEAANDEQRMQYYHDSYGFSGPDEISRTAVAIIPVNLTFYPIRPRDNLLSRLVSLKVDKLPESMKEELKTEGSLLIDNTDMTLYFDTPIELGPYLDSNTASMLKWIGHIDQTLHADAVMRVLKRKVTRRAMWSIYRSTTLNLDHFFCMGLEMLRSNQILRADFKRAIYLAALTVREKGSRRTHPTLHNRLAGIITDEPFDPFTNIEQLLESEGGLTIRNDEYFIDRATMDADYDFKDVRMQNVTRVIRNEVAPMKDVVDIIKHYVNLRPELLRSEIALRLTQRDLNEFDEDYRKYHSEESKPPSVGRPFFLDNPLARTGVLLCHGYLAAPEEIRPMAENLYRAGCSVYAMRLRGFGTSPNQLPEITLEDWQHSFDRAYAIIRNTCDRIVLAGFSAGALMALLNASRKTPPVDAVICINPALMLQDNRRYAVPAACAWHELKEKVRRSQKAPLFLDAEIENPDINYSRHCMSSICELFRLIHDCRGSLAAVTSPCMVIQADNDPVVKPEGADFVVEHIASTVREKIVVPSDRHVIVRGEGSEELFDRAVNFIRQHVDDRLSINKA